MNRIAVLAARSVIASLLAVPACSLAVDGTLSGRPARSDAGASDAQLNDSTIDTRPSDGAVVDAPQTDDSVPVDVPIFPDVPPIDPDAGCTSNLQCRNTNTCDGAETCVMGRCVDGTPLDDLTACDADFDPMTIDLCIAARCLPSRCGDGHANPNPAANEQCDDGNGVERDGCEPDCTFTCTMASDCDDGVFCNGDESCNLENHRCSAGLARDEMACMIVSGSTATNGTCVRGLCQPLNCGNGMIDSGEECDDRANTDPNDGCRADCTFSCHADDECETDGTMCNGTLKCDGGTHMCVQDRPAVMCDDADPCTTDSCKDASGECIYLQIDADRDGYSPSPGSTTGAVCTTVMGGDCDDNNNVVHPGATETCDGLDNDCNPTTPDGVTPSTWYRDDDDDGYGNDGITQLGCMQPMGPWVSRGGDCHDRNPSVHPGQGFQTDSYTNLAGSASFDWDCSGRTDYQYSPLECAASVCSIGGTICAVGSSACCLGASRSAGYPRTFRPTCGRSVPLTTCPSPLAGRICVGTDGCAGGNVAGVRDEIMGCR